MLSREDKESLLATSPIRPIEQVSTVCVGKPNAVSPHPTHPSPVGSSERKLPPDGDGRPGIPHLGQIVDHSPSKFLDVPVMEGEKKQVKYTKGLMDRMVESQLEMGPPPVFIDECSIEQNGFVAGRKNWSIPTLLKAVRDQKCRVFDCPLAAINLGVMPWDIKTVDDVIYHSNRAYKANLNHPIIIDWKGYVADGWHRIVKAVVLQQQTIRAYRLKEWVKPDFDGDKPDGSN